MAYQFVVIGIETGEIYEKGIVFKMQEMARAEAMAFIAKSKTTNRQEKLKVLVITVPEFESDADRNWQTLPQEIVRGEM